MVSRFRAEFSPGFTQTCLVKITPFTIPFSLNAWAPVKFPFFFCLSFTLLPINNCNFIFYCYSFRKIISPQESNMYKKFKLTYRILLFKAKNCGSWTFSRHQIWMVSFRMWYVELYKQRYFEFNDKKTFIINLFNK